MLNTDKLIFFISRPPPRNYACPHSVSAPLLLLLESFKHSWQEPGNGMLMSFSPEQSITQELQFKKEIKLTRQRISNTQSKNWKGHLSPLIF